MLTADKYVSCKKRYDNFKDINDNCKIIFDVLKNCLHQFPPSN